MLGLYRLRMLYAADETGLKRGELTAAMERLKDMDFARYDWETEFVWVTEMARFQLMLLRGEGLKEGDHRVKGIARLYRQLPSNPFLGPFYDRYAEVLWLPHRRDFLSESSILPSTLGASGKSLIRDDFPVPDVVLGRKGDTGETKSGSLASTELTVENIRERWNDIPGVKPCKAIGETIREKIHSRLKQHPQPEWWHRLFQLVKASDFLCGRTNGKNGPFHASLDWVLGPRNLDKILAGNYDSMFSSISSVTCSKRIPLNGSQFLRECGQPVSPHSRPTEPRCEQHLGYIPTSGGML
jgi:hypothetical protein